ncbi:MAG: hypothetical protein LC679_08735, partial [Intrasporangiaceae bacterium]|nr:hypothetical protein [Intrasporangiaceae bacterium]
MATLKTWMPTYLALVSEHDGRSVPLPGFRSYVSSLDTDKFSEDQTPSCVVVAPGTFDEPVRRGDNSYDIQWSVGVGVVVSGQTVENTFELCELYTAAVRLCLLQQASLGGVASGTDWLNERYDELLVEDLRTIAAGVVQFVVTVETAFRQAPAPLQPADASGVPVPPEDLTSSHGRVASTDVQIDAL